MAREAGTPAPGFPLTDSDGEAVTLSGCRGTPVYPNVPPVAFPPVCTDWFTPSARDSGPCAGAKVIGVSVDGTWSPAGFRKRMHADDVTVPADVHPTGDVARLYDVWLDQPGIAGHAGDVTDAEGVSQDVPQGAPPETPNGDRPIASPSACGA